MELKVGADSNAPEPIALFEFLDFEFRFEMATLLRCDMDYLVTIKRNEPTRYKEAAMNVFRVVSPACQLYIEHKGMQQKMAREKLHFSAASNSQC